MEEKLDGLPFDGGIVSDLSLALPSIPQNINPEEMNEYNVVFLLFPNTKSCTRWCLNTAQHWSLFLTLDEWEEWASLPERHSERLVYVERAPNNLIDNLRRNTDWWVDLERPPKLIVNRRVEHKGRLRISDFKVEICDYAPVSRFETPICLPYTKRESPRDLMEF